MIVRVLGTGSWGTALAQVLADNGCDVMQWGIDPQEVDDINHHCNKKYFDCEINENLKASTDLSVVKDADVLLCAVPVIALEDVLKKAREYLSKPAIIINVAKGIEQKTLERMSEIAEEHLDMDRYVVLSGPSHAEEVGRRLPTTVAAASRNLASAEFVQDLFITDRFRVYTTEDVVGVELGGALKNIIALGAGVSDGMGFGDNAKAALMTRGLAEIMRLGLKLGAKPETFAGLTGTGDLIVTCTSMHSRNRRCGIMIGEGMSPAEATEKVGMVVEGMFTTEAAYQLAKREGVEMPITEAIYRAVQGEIKASEAVEMLMNRERKHEQE